MGWRIWHIALLKPTSAFGARYIGLCLSRQHLDERSSDGVAARIRHRLGSYYKIGKGQLWFGRFGRNRWRAVPNFFL